MYFVGVFAYLRGENYYIYFLLLLFAYVRGHNGTQNY